jgi:hypothetical protein
MQAAWMHVHGAFMKSEVATLASAMGTQALASTGVDESAPPSSPDAAGFDEELQPKARAPAPMTEAAARPTK